MTVADRDLGGDNLVYRLRVNGRDRDVADAWLGESLLYVLRERLGLPGAKGACEQGECGSCSVIIDGNLLCSCLVLAASAVDREITTVEGLGAPAPDAAASDGDQRAATDVQRAATDVQRSFVEAGAVQCGYCTPGLVVAVHDLLERNDAPSELEVREALSGNICRCTGYGRILAAVERVVIERRRA